MTLSPKNAPLRRGACLLATTALVGLGSFGPALAQDSADDIVVLDTIFVDSAAEELKQALGVSTVTAEDVAEAMVSNDVSELVKTQPGVNLTGNTTSGQRGNSRQIDLRGMGPENTLILVDGRPVLSRNSTRMGRSGERDTRGDSNWVPASAIERIEVIRGPAAARYGSGAAGGVVNIITKTPDTSETTVTLFTEQPQSDKEGATYRGSLVSSGGLSETLSYRLILNANKTEGDDPDINEDATPEGENVAAGSEGVRNYDGSILLEYRPSAEHTFGVELGYSRQGNIYAGDALFQSVDRVDEDLIGEETNILQRSTLALTHRGDYAFGRSNSFIQWEHTDNSRLGEGLAGGGEGLINSDDFNTSLLDNVTAKTEWDVHSSLFGLSQTFTLGAEYRGEWLTDDVAVANDNCVSGTCVDFGPTDRNADQQAQSVGLYLEDNILLSDSVTLTPGLRYDYHSKAGDNWSPSLNMAWDPSAAISVKLGVSRAFKAPNLYQTNEGYIYKTRGRGCPVGVTGPCYIYGNEDLEAEYSWNKEIGASYTALSGFSAGLTYFKNDYHNKIQASYTPTDVQDNGSILQWVNVNDAVVEGLEGNMFVPFSDTLSWSTNVTVMLRSENLSTGQALSLVPYYTINSQVDWQATEALALSLALTHYGKTESPEKSITQNNEVENQDDRDPYTLVNLTGTYAFDNGLSVQAGIKNLMNTEIMREGTSNSAGANTYNEPGRSFVMSVSKTF